jgi:hypothetical protein
VADGWPAVGTERPGIASVCGDPPRPPNAAPPIIDVVAGLLAVGTPVLIAHENGPGYVLAIPAALFAGSAVFGFHVIRRCRSEAREYAAPIDCAAVRATADELRVRDGGTIRDPTFLSSVAVHRCFGQSTVAPVVSGPSEERSDVESRVRVNVPNECVAEYFDDQSDEWHLLHEGDWYDVGTRIRGCRRDGQRCVPYVVASEQLTLKCGE